MKNPFTKNSTKVEENFHKDVSSSINNVIKTTGNIGGAPLVIILFAVAMIIAIAKFAFDLIQENLIYILVFAGFLILIALIMFLIDKWWEKRQIIKQIDTYNKYSVKAFEKYLESENSFFILYLANAIEILQKILKGGIIEKQN